MVTKSFLLFVQLFMFQISYIILLLLYSFIILTRFKLDVHPAEYVLQGWVLTLLIEELRQLAIQEPKALFKKIEFYFQDPWNIVDSFSLMGFLVATILRYIAAHDQEMKYLIAARIIYATDIVLFIVRLLQIFSVNRNMGPKLVMIRKMVSKRMSDIRVVTMKPLEKLSENFISIVHVLTHIVSRISI